MTQPTQAQIEAADRIWHWLKRNANAERNDDKRSAFIESANAALTIIEDVKAALTAAAEVKPLLNQRALREASIDATIERCAQVADNHPTWPPIAIAAAIRALRDKP